MTEAEELASVLAWLMNLAKSNPRAWAPHCRHRAQELASKEPRVFEQLPALLAKGLTSLKQSTSTAASTAEPEKSDAP